MGTLDDLDDDDDGAEDALDDVDGLGDAADALGLGGVGKAIHGLTDKAGGVLDTVGGALDGLSNAGRDGKIIPPVTYYFLYGMPAKKEKWDDPLDVGSMTDIGHLADKSHLLDGVIGANHVAPIRSGLESAGILSPDEIEHAKWLVSQFYCEEGLSKLFRMEVTLVRRVHRPGETDASAQSPYNTIDDAKKDLKEIGDIFDQNVRDPNVQRNPTGGIIAAVGLGNVVDEGRNYIAKEQKAQQDTQATGQRFLNDWNNPDADNLLSDMTRQDAAHDPNAPDGPIPVYGQEPPVDPGDFLGKPCSLSIYRSLVDGEKLTERWFTGVAVEFEDLGYRYEGFHAIRLVVVPSLYKLAMRKNCRIFEDQDQTTLSIIKKILTEAKIYQDDDLKVVPGEDIVPDGVPSIVGDLIGAVDKLASGKDHWTSKREYCVQYNETDLDFVLRLMEEDGITFYFDHMKRQERLILIDDPRHGGHKCKTIDGRPIEVDFQRSDVTAENIWDFQPWKRSISSNKVTLRDFNYSKPNSITECAIGYDVVSLDDGIHLPSLGDLASKALSLGNTDKDVNKVLGDSYSEIYEYYPRLLMQPDNDDDPLSGQYKGYSGKDLAKFTLEALHAQATLSSGASNVSAMRPGSTAHIGTYFGVKGAKPGRKARKRKKGTSFLITSVVHSGQWALHLQGWDPGNTPNAVYTNRFHCVDVKTTRYRPPMITERPKIRGLQTALVVDHEGKDNYYESKDEVFADKVGRIKVRFPWDRRTDDKAVSSWIRVGSSAAGAGWGTVFTPRAGMEVVVSYLDGNPDRPIVMGSLYSGNYGHNNYMPVEKPIPARDDTRPLFLDDHLAVEHQQSSDKDRLLFEETRSWIKTNSIPKNWTDPADEKERYNELSFRDLKAAEEIRLRAQSDFIEDVGQDHHTRVDVDQDNVVGRDHIEEIKTDQKLRVEAASGGGDRTKIIHGNEFNNVQKDENQEKGRSEEITGNERLTILGKREEQVDKDDVIKILGKTEDAREFTQRVLVSGSRKIDITQTDKLIVSGKKEVDVKGNLLVKAAQIQMGAVGDDVGQAGAKETGVGFNDQGAYINSKGSVLVEAKGDLMVKSTDGKIHIKASTEIKLECGSGTQIVMNAKDGTIVIQSEEEKNIQFVAGRNSMELKPTSIKLVSQGIKDATTLELTAEGGANNKNIVLTGGEVDLKFVGEVHLNGATVDANKN